MIRKSPIGFLSLAAALMLGAGAIAQTSFVFSLDPSQEIQTPAVVSSARGVAFATLSPTNVLSLFVFHNVANVTAGHIHNAPAGSNGGVLIPFPSAASPIGFSTTLSPANAALLMSGGLYVNIHSSAFPGGEIRGQMVNSFAPKVYISEYCNDPFGATGIDANGDGTAATSAAQFDDEFVEIVNGTDQTVNIGGWMINDGFGLRHTFDPNTLMAPGSAIVVFGGGVVSNFNTAGNAGVTASTGTLGLNNTADSITIFDPAFTVIDTVSWPASGPGNANGESTVRVPEIPTGTQTNCSVANPGVLHTAGFHNDNIFQWPAATIPAPQFPAYPGNNSDCAITVSINGSLDTPVTNQHAVMVGDLVTVRYVSPNLTLVGTPILGLAQIFNTGFAPAALLLPGDAQATVVLNLAQPIVALADGLSAPGGFFAPILGSHTVSTVVPAVFSGSGLSSILVLLCADPGRNAVNLGNAPAHELIFQ